ncbi:MAG: hypothetical protein P4L34_10910 [Paludibacter sp.]|nr:hypothetical protein [Paludibacter sp.]
MNLIQTLYIDPSKRPFTDSFGWLKPEYHLMSWALSCLQLQKLYGNVELYANSTAAELLIDILELPYTTLHTNHDDLKLADTNLWALPKIYTYSLQDEPFLHIDGDVFIFNKFADSLLQSSLITQNIEVATDYYTITQKQLMENFTYFPPCVKADFYSNIPINAVNAGILGGNNISFIKQYTTEAFKYVNSNINHFQNINIDKFNVFFEQHLFYSLAKEQNIPINFLFNDIFEDRGYLYLGNFQEVPYERTYLHLLGHYKRDKITCMQMAAKLRELYPEYYYKIIALCKKQNVTLFTSFYNDKNIDKKSEYQQLIDKATESFQNDIRIDNNECSKSKAEPDLSLLKKIFDMYVVNSHEKLDLQYLKNDFDVFTQKLNTILKENALLSDYYLYGRDIAAAGWYAEIFINNNFLNKIISRTEGLNIIESEYNWAGLINKHTRIGIQYYETLTLSQEHFFNLVIPEIIGNKFLLYDIDELEKKVLEHLSEPLSVKDLFTTMQQYFDDDVIQNHYDAFEDFIVKVIKQLVVKKAIKPSYC